MTTLHMNTETFVFIYIEVMRHLHQYIFAKDGARYAFINANPQPPPPGLRRGCVGLLCKNYNPVGGAFACSVFLLSILTSATWGVRLLEFQ